jgi:hypothetical protein
MEGNKKQLNYRSGNYMLEEKSIKIAIAKIL